MAEFEDLQLFPLPQALWVRSWSCLQPRAALSQLWAAAGHLLCHCSVFDQHMHIPDNIMLLTVLLPCFWCSGDNHDVSLPAWLLDLTAFLGFDLRRAKAAPGGTLTGTPRFLTRCKLIPSLAAVDKVVLKEVLSVGIAQSRGKKKLEVLYMSSLLHLEIGRVR